VYRRLLADGSVEKLTGGVGMPGVSSRFVDEVAHDPSQ
jgi:hypothetical protein